MEQQLRLADRRGVFTRPMSLVAEFGLMILDMLEARQRSEKEFHEVKLAMAIGEPKSLPELFPEWFNGGEVEAGTPEADMALASGTAVEDYSEVKWLSPKDMADSDLEELMALSESLLAASQVSVSQDFSGEWH